MLSRILFFPPMLLLLESPVGVAILDLNHVVIDRFMFASPEMAHFIYCSMESDTIDSNLVNDSHPLSVDFRSFLAFLTKNISEPICVNNPSYINSLHTLLGIKVVYNVGIFKSVKKNTFKYFGINKNIYNMMTILLSKRLISQGDNSHANKAFDSFDGISLLNTIESMETSINNRVMRVREWYSLHFPELNRIEDNKKYLETIIRVKSRDEYAAEHDKNGGGDGTTSVNSEDASDIVIDNNSLIFLSRNSMGSHLSKDDLQTIIMDASDILKSMLHKDYLSKLLKSSVESNMPNLSKLVNEVILTKIIRKVGSLSKLSQKPASTIQILGSEKAYSESILQRDNGNAGQCCNTPKYGYIFNSYLISKAVKKGKIARMLANKIALCAKVDLNGEYKSGEFGRKCFEEIEDKISEKMKEKKKHIKTRKTKISVLEYDERLDK